MGKCYYRTPDGKCFLENDFFPIVKTYAGYDTRTLNRQLFLRILYDFTTVSRISPRYSSAIAWWI
ncbi:hypothetical protein BDW68DRAFT_182444 [Aspergillus falconensis]